jgi:hypothetical protein
MRQHFSHKEHQVAAEDAIEGYVIRLDDPEDSRERGHGSFWVIVTRRSESNTLQALHRSHFDVAKLLTKDDIQPGALTARNREGLIPLHIAVLYNSIEQVELLLEAAARSNLDINIENGMGDSPLDIARQQLWLDKTRDATSMGAGSEPTLLVRRYLFDLPDTPKIDVSDTKERLGHLKSAVADLVQNGDLVHGTPVASALSEFVSRLDKHVEHLRALDLTIKAKKEETTEMKKEGMIIGSQESKLDWLKRHVKERQLVLEMVQNAYASRKPPRRLVHLEDVQELVQLELDWRHAEAEKKIEALAKAAEHEVGLLEEHRKGKEEEQGPTFYGFREIGAFPSTASRRKVWRTRASRRPC